MKLTVNQGNGNVMDELPPILSNVRSNSLSTLRPLNPIQRECREWAIWPGECQQTRTKPEGKSRRKKWQNSWRGSKRYRTRNKNRKTLIKIPLINNVFFEHFRTQWVDKRDSFALNDESKTIELSWVKERDGQSESVYFRFHSEKMKRKSGLNKNLI